MIKVGGKAKAAIMMVAATSPSSVGGRYFRRGHLLVLPLSRTGSSCSEVVSEKKNRGGGGDDAEDRTVGDIQVYSRVTGQILEFDIQDKKSWWMPHPVTGEFSPYGQEALHVTMEEDEKNVRSSAGP